MSVCLFVYVCTCTHEHSCLSGHVEIIGYPGELVLSFHHVGLNSGHHVCLQVSLQAESSQQLTLFLKTRSLMCLELTECTKLADQQTLGISLSLPPECWGYKQMPPHLDFCNLQLWGGNSGRLTTKAPPQPKLHDF